MDKFIRAQSFCGISFVILIFAIIISGPASAFHVSKIEISTNDQQSFINGFKGFSADMMCLQPQIADASTFGSYSLGPLLIMSVLNEKIWKIRTDGFSRGLRVPEENITQSTATILTSLLKDCNTKFNSRIFTPRNPEDSYLGANKPGLEDLDTQVSYIDRWAWENGRKYFNGHIRSETNGKLFGDFIPKGGWFGPDIVNNYTRAILINTFLSEHKWNVDFRRNSKTKEIFSKFSGKIGFLDKALFTAYSIPLNETIDPILTGTFQSKLSASLPPRRSVVFVQPKVNSSEFLPKIKDLFDVKSEDWSEREGSLQIPFVNLSLATSTELQFEKLGIRKTFCNVQPSEENFVQRIAQNLNIYLGPDAIRFVGASGAALSNFAEFAEALGINPKDLENRPDIGSTEETCLDCQCSSGSGRQKRTKREGQVKGRPPITTKLPGSTVTIKTPFLVYLNDVELGPIFVGLVNKLEEKDEEEDSFGLGDIVNYSKWSCR